MKRLFTIYHLLIASRHNQKFATRFMLPVVLLPLVAMFFCANVQAQTTIVNYLFNDASPVNYSSFSSGAVANITSTLSSDSTFTTPGAGNVTTATIPAAFTTNSTAGSALTMGNSSRTNVHYEDFAITGSALCGYNTFKVYFQALRQLATGTQSLTVQYSLNGGAYTNFTSNTMALTAGTWASAIFTLPAAVDNPTTSLAVRIYATGPATGSTALRIDNFQIQAVSGPRINPVGTLAALSTTYGTASSATTFTVGGAFLTNDILVTPPAGFEVSTALGGPYTSSVTLTQSGGIVASTIIYIRLIASDAAGTYSGNIVCTSTGATTQNIATTLSTVNPKGLIITASDVSKNYGATLTGGTGSSAFTSSGLIGIESIGSVSIAYGGAAAAGTAIGVYSGQVTPSLAIGGTFNASNYTITYATGAITVNPVLPAVSTPTVTAIGSTSATLGATVTSDGTGAGVTARGTSFKISSPVAATDNQLAEGGTTTGVYTHSRTLNPETRYWYVGYATNGAGTGISAEGNFYTYSNPVTTQAANLVATASSFSQVDLSWDAAIFPASGATVKGYVLLRATGASIPTFTSANGTVPAAGVGTIVSSTILDPTISFSNTGLSQTTTYNYLLIPYTWDGTNAATYNYLTASAVTATATTPVAPCTPPATQVTAAVVGGATASTLNISWTAGSGTNSFVIVRAGSAVNQVPVTGTLYNASAVFGAGDNLGSSNFACYSGSGNSFTLTNLSATTTYYVAVYTYNLSGYCFNLTSPSIANGTTTVAPSVIETFEPGTKGSYTNGNDLCNLGNWNFNNALVGQSASDLKNGAKSARIQSTGSITMLFDKANGLGIVSIKHGLFGSDISTTWRMDVSDDGGATFVAYQSPVQTTTLYSLATVTFTPNITGNQIRIRIVKLSGGTTSRLNIDDINMGDYVSTNSVTAGAFAGSPFCITNATGASVNVPFSSTGTFNAGNVFTAQLSDGTGSFTLAQDIGTLTAFGLNPSGTIAATIPAGTATGAAYKIRVVASDPVIIGSASASVLTLNLNTPDVTGVSGGPFSGSVAVSWTNPVGCYNDIVVMAFTSSISCTPSGTSYAFNNTYGSGATCSGVGTGFSVYQGTGTSVTVTGLTNGVTYYFKVFVRNGTIWSTGVQVTAVPTTVADGDYQSIQTGQYNAISTWQKRISGSWQASPDVPGTGNAGTANVTVNAGHTVNLTASAANLAIKTLTVVSGGRIYGSSASNVYMTLYGDIVCNGTIGTDAVTWNSISFNMEGVNSTISGSGNFYASRLRKNFSTVNTTTNLIIAMNMYLLWNTGSGTTMYNNSTGTIFNVTVNQNATLTAVLAGATSGNMAINSTNGGTGGVNRGGTYTINGTMNIPGILYATNTSATGGFGCNWIIGNTGVVNCNQINCDASGAAGHTFTILNGGRLNINTIVGFNTATATSFSTTNNTYDLQPGSIVEYSAPSGITHILTDLTYSNLVVSGSGTKDLIDKNLSQTGITLRVNKNVTITGSSVLDPSNPGLTNPSNAILVGGNWNNYATGGFNEAFSNVTFNGFSGAQKIYCPGGENFYNMTVSNTDPAGAELNTDVTVANNLDLGSTGRLFFGPTPSIMKLTNMAAASSCFLGSGSAMVDMSQSASTLYIGCESPNYSGGFNAGTTSLVNYNRDVATSLVNGNQDVLTTITYANLSVSGSDLKKTNNDFAVTQTLTVDGASTSLEANTVGKILTLGGNLTLSGGGTMGGTLGTSCLANLSITTAAASAALAQTFNGGFNTINCYNLSTDKSANGIVLISGNTNLTISNNLTQTTAAQLTPNDNRVKIGNVWSLWGPAGFNKGTSTIEFNGTVAQNINALDYYNLETSSTGGRTLISGATTGVANTFTPGVLNAFTVLNSTVDFNGVSANQTITSTAFSFYNVGFKNGGIKSLGAAVSVQKTMTMGVSTTFALSTFNLTLRSVSGLTANVTTVPASATIDQASTGRFIVERYVEPLRSWRLLTAPINTLQTIKAAWMEGSAPATYPSSNPDNLPNYGTHITGPSPAANGFDASPQNNYSMKYYINGTGWVGTAAGVSLKTSDDITSKPGWMIFVRGNRSYDILNTNVGTPAVYTTLRTTGKINVGDRPALTIPPGFTIVANPYASAINFSSVTKVPAATANDIFYVWDAKRTSGSTSTTVGGWIALTRGAGNTYIPNVPPVSSTIDLTTGRIESGVAIAVDGANLTSVTIKETDKSDISTLFFRPQPPRHSIMLRTNLYVRNSDSSLALFDGTLMMFGKNYSSDVDGADARKQFNTAENLSIADKGILLSIDKRDMLTKKDTIFYSINQMRVRNYTFEFIADEIAENNLAGFIEDKFMKTKTALNMRGTTTLDFNIINNPGSYAADRFRIVFKKAVKFDDIKAASLKNDISVDWKVEEENEINHYEILRSADGENFSKIGSQYTKYNELINSYNWMDEGVTPGIYFYQIKAISNNGVEAFSDVVKVKVINCNSPMLVFPNPVTDGTIQLQLNNKVAGTYLVRLMNGQGQVVSTKNVQHTGGTVTQKLETNNALPSGIYDLEVTEPGKKISVIKVFMDKK